MFAPVASRFEVTDIGTSQNPEAEQDLAVYAYPKISRVNPSTVADDG
jgi:hypothetical protein